MKLAAELCAVHPSHTPTQGIITYPPVQICLRVGQYTAACAVREEIVMQPYLTPVPDQIRLLDWLLHSARVCMCSRKCGIVRSRNMFLTDRSDGISSK